MQQTESATATNSSRMKTFAIILCSNFVFTSSYDHKQCDKKGTLFYESLFCKPEFLGTEECPQYFQCDGLEVLRNGCLLKGKHYEIGETVEENVQASYCKADCSCKKIGNHAEFQCASVDCPENEDSNDSDCYYGHQLGHCCSTHKLCPPFSNTTCKVGNTIFREGEHLYLNDSCTECICQRGFVGKYTVPFCKRIDCPLQLNNAQEIAKHCAPVFLAELDSPLCCPVTFICPTGFSLNLTNYASSKDDLSCAFGDKSIKKGATFKTNVEDLGNDVTANCKCEIPPFITCRVQL